MVPGLPCWELVDAIFFFSFLSFFLVAGEEEEWGVLVPVQNVALRCLLLSFSPVKEGQQRIAFPFI